MLIIITMTMIMIIITMIIMIMIILIGLGAGTVPAFLAKALPHCEVDAVELEPKRPEICHKVVFESCLDSLL